MNAIITAFLLGFVLGGVAPSYAAYLTYRRNQHLRKQLTKELD